MTLQKKVILTPCSSSDHIFNMLLCGATSIDTYDINIFTSYFFYLKEAALRTLNYELFLEFFCPSNFFTRSNAFSDSLYFVIEKNIQNSEVKEFWNYLYNRYGGKRLYHSNLFIQNYYRQNTYIESNPYLKNKENYEVVRQKLENYQFRFFHINIFQLATTKILFDNIYDIIYLSNILDTMEIENEIQYTLKIKEIIECLMEYLSTNGVIAVCYLYCYLDDYWYDYQQGRLKSYHIRQQYFKDDYYYADFAGIGDLKSRLVKNRDALMLTRKK